MEPVRFVQSRNSCPPIERLVRHSARRVTIRPDRKLPVRNRPRLGTGHAKGRRHIFSTSTNCWLWYRRPSVTAAKTSPLTEVVLDLRSSCAATCIEPLEKEGVDISERGCEARPENSAKVTS